MRKSGEIEHPLNPSTAISAISGESMTLTENTGHHKPVPKKHVFEEFLQ
jgi:hypothetical protein